MALLGDDGLGYDLARRLESCGVWRSWLGDACYASFVLSLASPSSWESFMRVDDAKSRAQVHLQLRVRALLFDKASISLFLRPQSDSTSSSSSSAIDVSKLNPSYLRLHGDDVYYTLEDSSRDGVPNNGAPLSKGLQGQAKVGYSVGSRYSESDRDNASQRSKLDELPESWYSQFIEKYTASTPYKLSSGNREPDKRTPEGMARYLRHLDKYKRRKVPIKDDQYMGSGNPVLGRKLTIRSDSVLENSFSDDDDTPFFPETMYTWNCVPDSALPLRPKNGVVEERKIEFFGVLDTLPKVVARSRSPIMIERLGIRPEFLAMEQGGNLYHGKCGSRGTKEHLGEEQASLVSKKVIARMLINVGFDSATEIPIGVLSQLLSCHIRKLGHILKVLSDSYRKQCSAIELLKMFLHTAGYSNLGALAEQVKESTSTATQQTQPHIQGIQSQMQLHMPPVSQTQQVPRQVHPHVQPMMHPQNLAFQQQQQWEKARRRQASAPRTVTSLDKDRPMVQVKVEATEFPIDGNAFNSINSIHPQLQLRQQQIATMSNLQSQPSNQFRQMSPQISQMHTQAIGTVRAPPVKVEGFQELMGGDATSNVGENRLTSPSK